LRQKEAACWHGRRRQPAGMAEEDSMLAWQVVAYVHTVFWLSSHRRTEKMRCFCKYEQIVIITLTEFFSLNFIQFLVNHNFSMIIYCNTLLVLINIQSNRASTRSTEKSISTENKFSFLLWHDAWKLQSAHLLGGASLNKFSWQHGRRRCWTANCWNTFPQQQIWLKKHVLHTGKGKVIPVQAVEALRFERGWGPHIFRYSAHRWRQGCQPYAPAAFYPQDDSWYSFLLEAGSTPGP
jgi:hypothetical protein